jgi:hypothetical protein
MDTINTEVPSIAGTPFAGGFFAGLILVNGVRHALVVAPRAEGEHDEIRWSKGQKVVEGALSFFDGLANTRAMAEAGSELAAWAQGLRIGGFDDWYVPSRDELEILYRAFKPTAEENYCWRGDNPSSVPVGYAYSRTVPGKTSAAAFQEGGSEALGEDGYWYWSSTQDAGSEAYAWCQYFDDGGQYYGHKSDEYRARAVRRLKI